MANHYFQFKQFTIHQDRCAFKVGTDGVLLGAEASVSSVERVLDVGAGTGLISLMIAQRSMAMITAIEPDTGSFSQLVENVSKSPWRERIKVLNVTLQEYSLSGCNFDLIVSNPPYFTDSIRNPDPRISSTRHNYNLPQTELLAGVSKLLSENGIFQVIMPYAEGTVLIAEAASFGLFCIELLKIKPLPSSPVRRLIITFSRQKGNLRERFLTIEHGQRHDFTTEYIELTKDFYLKF
jgi:tRNA1Val (adenine37-N6)-methyltransferase